MYNRTLFSHKKIGNPFATIGMDPEGIMLSKRSQRETDTVWSHLHVEFLKSQTHGSRSGKVISGALEGGANEVMLVKWYKIPVISWISCGDLICSMITIVKNTVLYTWNLLRE